MAPASAGRSSCLVQWLPVAVASALVGLLAPPGISAQLSPGDLSRAHAELEGSGNCLQCHQAKRRVDPGLCLSCHEPLSRRVEAGRGLHAQQGYERCETCHIEHHGRQFELIWWGEEGRDSFDHAQTGFPLEGAHRRSGCDDCHRSDSIVDREELEKAGKDLEKTFLGLDRRCLSCHEDEHRGQVEADSCETCHDSNAWDPASAFDHGRTRFPLTGLHVVAACTACHATLSADRADGPATYLQFAVAAFSACSDCHRDPHEGNLGPRCSTCHSTSGWSRYDRRLFDHSQTGFELVGAHGTVACDQCHQPGGGFKIERFERCADCHDDEHLGQFASSVERQGCTSCHSVDAFAPSTYTLADHQESEYPLEGAHLAIPCIACHEEITPSELSAEVVVPTVAKLFPERVRRFRFEATECEDCHGDPHDGELDRWRERSGCESCHEVAGWRRVTFDHDETGLPLRGKHQETGCGKCHVADPGVPEGTPMRLAGAVAACSSCHEDPHMAQFSAPDGSVRCETCHEERDWIELLFDHTRDSRFSLEGAHRKLECAACHPVEAMAERAFVRYRPLARTCEACHAASDIPFQ